ncbi:hypothetical protein Lser_V15G10017 [Lactuca serriola]
MEVAGVVLHQSPSFSLSGGDALNSLHVYSFPKMKPAISFYLKQSFTVKSLVASMGFEELEIISDLRRTLKASKEGIFKLTVGEMCNRNPRTISAERMVVEAMKKMEAPPSPVQFLPVIDEDKKLIGIVTLHGLVSIGL